MIAMPDLRPLMPALIVALTGIAVLLAQAFTPRGRQAPSLPLALAGLLGALLAVALIAAGRGRGTTTAGAVSADDFALFFQALLIAIAILALLLSPGYLRNTGSERGEYYALVLFALVGMFGLVSCLELVSLFVALEIMSVAFYALAGFDRGRIESQEAALKYS
jgi:NADH-quinone oxidoreductase subunit N